MSDAYEIKHNLHPDFNKVQASRPDWSNKEWHYSKTKDPTWRWGQGASDGGESLKKGHIEINPYEEGSQSSLCQYSHIYTEVTEGVLI